MTQSASSPGYTGGILNMVGVRPGKDAYQYDGPAMKDGVWFSVTLTSTYDAIERLVVPPGLQVDREAPPEVTIQYFINPETRAFDGRVTPYQGFVFQANVRHGDTTGRAGWEYVDSVYGDKTDMDIMGSWAVYFGMMKKMADIRFIPLGGNEFEATVTRRGVRLVTMTIRCGAELSEADVDLMNAASTRWPNTLTVREIPNVNHSGFVDRSVCICRCETGMNIKQAWTADKGSLTFGHDAEGLDPMDELPVLGISNEMIYRLDVTKENFSQMEVLESLPTEVDEVVGAGQA